MLLESLLGWNMKARVSICLKEFDKALHSPTVEDCVSYAVQMLALVLPQEHYMFLLAVHPARESIECS
jgi:hypothetical protein